MSMLLQPSLFDEIDQQEVDEDDPRSIMQRRAVRQIGEALDRGVKRQLIRAVTGFGKTRLSKMVFEEFGDGRPGLYLVHRRKLAHQTKDSFRDAGMNVGVEMARETVAPSGDSFSAMDVMIGSKDSLKGDRLWTKWRADHFGVIVVDEAHRALGKSFTSTIRRFSDCRLIVFQTATPKKGMIPDLADEQTFNCTIDEAVACGVIVPFRVFEADAVVNLKDLRKTKKADYDEAELQARILSAVGDIAQGTVEAVRSQGGTRGIMFVPGVEAAIRLAEAITACGIPSEAVHGNGPNFKMSPGMQRDIMARHRRGEFELLVSCDLLTEGYDDTSIDYVVMARPTKQTWLHLQMAGRGLRLHPGKSECLIYGFGYETDRGRRSSLDLFYADDDNPAAAARAAEASRDKARKAPVDPLAERKEAEEVEELLRKQQELWRASLSPVDGTAEGLRRQRTIRELGGILQSKPGLQKLARSIEKGRVPVTMEVAGRLARIGMGPKDIGSFRSPFEAEAAADEWEAREACGMATFKQVRLLVNAGSMGQDEAMNLSKREAHALVGRALRANGWR